MVEAAAVPVRQSKSAPCLGFRVSGIQSKPVLKKGPRARVHLLSMFGDFRACRGRVLQCFAFWLLLVKASLVSLVERFNSV